MTRLIATALAAACRRSRYTLLSTCVRAQWAAAGPGSRLGALVLEALRICDVPAGYAKPTL